MQRKTDALDRHIGLRLKMRRILLNLTQDDLAKKLNITFQQIQKYEKATNRISASRLYDIAKILNTSINYFYEGYSDGSIEDNDFVAENVATVSISVNKETLNNNDVIAELINMPASTHKKNIFSYLREELITTKK